MATQTKFFKACRGVFEGGGCRGAGYVGAYEAAIECGINFSEVSGTSAGSIIAALIGAGASPEFLLEKCAYLKFSDLLVEPKQRISSPVLGHVVSYFLYGKKKLFGKILRKGAAYSSENLEIWLDELLAKLLPQASRPIRFKNLITPTWIVATDLAGKRPKVWSTKDTPDAKVAMAVRSSCSIPLFFEPVESGNDFFVDGGMLSNLPSFVFSDQQKSPHALGGRILAFRLVEDEELQTEWTLDWLVRRLIDTAISGATNLQIEMQGNISTIDIKTGNVSGTNFNISKDEIDSLLISGRSAVKKFIANEHSMLSDSLQMDVSRFSEDELYEDIVREMETPGKRLIVSCRDTLWFWKLFPSVVHWLFAGSEIDILVDLAATDAREQQRRNILQELGARVVETNSISTYCFLLSRNDDRHNSVFIRDISATEHSPMGVVYIGTKHRSMIEVLLRDLDNMLGSTKRSQPQLFLKESDQDKLISNLKKGVHQYNTSNVTIEMREVPLKQGTKEALKMIVRRVRSFKYRQVEYLTTLYERFGIQFCKPADIFANGQYVSTIVPPVLEEWGGQLIAIEGNTRVYFQTRNGAEFIHCLVVKGVTTPLPGCPVYPREALLSTYHLPSSERISGFVYDNFRSIEGAARPVE